VIVFQEVSPPVVIQLLQCYGLDILCLFFENIGEINVYCASSTVELTN